MAVTVGSEIAAGVDDIHISKCHVSQTQTEVHVKQDADAEKILVLKGIVFEDLELQKV